MKGYKTGSSNVCLEGKKGGFDNVVMFNEDVEIVVVNNANSDTESSSNESGFGTDDLDNKILNTQEIKTSSSTLTPQQQHQQQQQQQQNQQQPLHPLKLQPTSSKIIYELRNGKNNDDVANILNDNSSINSLSSSSTQPNLCARIIEAVNGFYLSCCCCYSPTPLIWSWLSIFCCCCPLLGCVSLYFTRKSKKLKLKQKYDLAEKYSGYAEKLNIASLIFGVIFYAIAFFLITLVVFMYWRHNNS